MSSQPLSSPVPTAAPSPTWFTDIKARLRVHLPLKVVGTTAVTWLFFIGYFYLLHHPSGPVTVMPMTALDSWLTFRPQALGVYVSLWFYVGIAPGLQLNFRALAVYGVWVGLLCLSGLVWFYLWPTAIAPLNLDISEFPTFAVLQGVDASGNAFPSMHVAVSMFTALHIEDVLRRERTPAALRWLNAAWFVAIAYSTLAVKQHVVWDVVAGALLGLAWALPSLRWRPAPR